MNAGLRIHALDPHFGGIPAVVREGRGWVGAAAPRRHGGSLHRQGR